MSKLQKKFELLDSKKSTNGSNKKMRETSHIYILLLLFSWSFIE